MSIAEFIRNGVAFLPLFTAAEVADWNARIRNNLKRMPEYLDAEHATKLVDEGFGAPANLASFHNFTVRALWVEVSKRTRAFFIRACSQLHPHDAAQWRIEQLMDRLSHSTDGLKHRCRELAQRQCAIRRSDLG